MMLFFTALALLAILRVKKASQAKYDYMSIEMTNSIKGFFLWMVFLAHIWTYADFSNAYLDFPYQLVKKITGQCIVTMFLFYSGYGIMESIRKKSEDYIHSIPVHRFLNTLLQFDSAIILFWIYRLLTGSRYNIKTMLLVFVGWSSIGNSNWYIFCILCLYVFTYISFTVFQNSHLKAALGVFLLSLLYMAVMCKAGKEYWWYDTILCYSYGILFSIYRTKIESFINESFNSWLFFLSIFFIGYMTAYLYRNVSSAAYQIYIFCFVAAIITFTMRFVVDSPQLRQSGANLFGLYILQRLPMMILKPYILSGEITVVAKYVYVIACMISTIIIATIFKKTIIKTIKKVTLSLYEHFS